MKEQIINHIIDVEGGYVNDPSDSGGETNFGITVGTARRHGFRGAMVDMTRDHAFVIYSELYWDSVRADDMPGSVAAEVVDTGVNCGTSRAGKFLQRALNVLTPGKAIAVDGAIGSGTIRRLNEYLAKRDEATLVKMLNCLQGAFYVELAERREKDERFIYGWFKNRVVI
jgi:lysozyme family protein